MEKFIVFLINNKGGFFSFTWEIDIIYILIRTVYDIFCYAYDSLRYGSGFFNLKFDKCRKHGCDS